MNKTTNRMGALLAALMIGPMAQAQFVSGSTGAAGALTVTENTSITAPPDGVFHYTTVTVGQNVTLTILPNANNTPVYILATGDVTVNGTINASGATGNAVVGGRPGPGGFPGGNPGSDGSPAGDGGGPGAGLAGTAATSESGAGAGGHASKSTSGSSARHGDTYGSPLLIPAEGGSGGGGTPTSGGGGGGGALTIASTTSITVAASGRIEAIGGGNTGSAINGGSGGSIRLVAPLVTGTGFIYTYGQGGGGNGRHRVDTLDRVAVAGLRFNNNNHTTIGSMMVVRPEPMPRLDITAAAGTDIALGSGPVQVILPFGASPNVTVTVRAEHFGAVVPIALSLTPDNGPSTLIEDSIDNAAANPATKTINVTLPINVQTTISVWTR